MTSESALPDTSFERIGSMQIPSLTLCAFYMVLLVPCVIIAVWLANFSTSFGEREITMLGLSNTYIPIGDSSFSPSLFFIEEEGP